jgi:hypothetical protein
MTKKELAVLGGVCTIVGAVTAANRKRQWQDVHVLAVIVGALVTIAGAAS